MIPEEKTQNHKTYSSKLIKATLHSVYPMEKFLYDKIVKQKIKKIMATTQKEINQIVATTQKEIKKIIKVSLQEKNKLEKSKNKAILQKKNLKLAKKLTDNSKSDKANKVR